METPNKLPFHHPRNSQKLSGHQEPPNFPSLLSGNRSSKLPAPFSTNAIDNRANASLKKFPMKNRWWPFYRLTIWYKEMAARYGNGRRPQDEHPATYLD